MDVLQSGVYTEFTWSRNHVAASGANQVYLLVEWRGSKVKPRNQIANSRHIAEEVQLHLQLGSGVRLKALYGCKVEMLNELNCTLWIGSLPEGEDRRIVLEFDFASHPSGTHPIVTALCTYKDGMNRQVILPSRTISLQFSNHTAVHLKKVNHRVEKCMKILQNPAVLESALLAFERGCYERGEEIIRRRADEMLLQAIRLGDADYLEEAEILYALSHTFINTYEAAAAG